MGTSDAAAIPDQKHAHSCSPSNIEKCIPAFLHPPASAISVSHCITLLCIGVQNRYTKATEHKLIGVPITPCACPLMELAQKNSQGPTCPVSGHSFTTAYYEMVAVLSHQLRQQAENRTLHAASLAWASFPGDWSRDTERSRRQQRGRETVWSLPSLANQQSDLNRHFVRPASVSRVRYTRGKGTQVCSAYACKTHYIPQKAGKQSQVIRSKPGRLAVSFQMSPDAVVIM
jgi:hypothetical protein